jgi:NADPH-dependent curcumin reductase CurA
MNKQIILAKRPTGLPEEDTWQLTETPIPSIEDGQVLVKQLYISLDPAMRGWISDRKSYIPPVQIGEVMRAGSVGKIIASKHPRVRKRHASHGVGEAYSNMPLPMAKGWFPSIPT